MLKSIFYCCLKYSPVKNSQLLQFNTKPLATCLNRYLSNDSSKPRQPIDLDKLVHLTNKRKIMKYPYNIFIQQNVKVTKQEHPEITKPSELLVKTAEKWRLLSNSEKQFYYDEGEKNHKRHQAEIDALFEGYTDEEKLNYGELVKELRKEMLLEKRKKKMRMEKKSLGKPSRPLNAFGLFAQSLDRGDAGFEEFTHGASLKWNSLPEQDREKFKAEQRALSKEYHKRIKEWCVKMIAEHKEEYIPKQFIQRLKLNLEKFTPETKQKTK